MNRMMTSIVFLAVMTGSILFCRAVNETNEATDTQSRRSKFKEMFDRLQPVHVYGKVVDQDGNPICGADVLLGWETASLLIGKPDYGQSTVFKSDSNGRWAFTIEKPHRAFVDDVCKSGYYSYKETKNESSRDLIYQPTSQDTPIVTVLRKKGETTFLIVHPGGNRIGDQLIRVLSPQSQTNSLDLLSERPDKPKFRSYSDVQVEVDYGGMPGKWTVTYSATNGTDGIIIGTNILYEAPQDGYQKEVVLSGPSWPKYLYLRSRTPAIYSRLELEHSIWKETETNQGFRISYKAWVNPYGDRNLEYETELEKDWRLYDRLTDEAKDAFGKGKRPIKPDLPKLIKDDRYKAGKDKSKP